MRSLHWMVLCCVGWAIQSSAHAGEAGDACRSPRIPGHPGLELVAIGGYLPDDTRLDAAGADSVQAGLRHLSECLKHRSITIVMYHGDGTASRDHLGAKRAKQVERALEDHAARQYASLVFQLIETREEVDTLLGSLGVERVAQDGLVLVLARHDLLGETEVSAVERTRTYFGSLVDSLSTHDVPAATSLAQVGSSQPSAPPTDTHETWSMSVADNVAARLVHRADALGSSLLAVELVVPIRPDWRALALPRCKDAESLLRAAGLPASVVVGCETVRSNAFSTPGVEIYLLTAS